MYVNVPTKSRYFLNISFLLASKVHDENSRIWIHYSEAWIRGYGSTPKCYGSATLRFGRFYLLNWKWAWSTSVGGDPGDHQGAVTAHLSHTRTKDQTSLTPRISFNIIFITNDCRVWTWWCIHFHSQRCGHHEGVSPVTQCELAGINVRVYPLLSGVYKEMSSIFAEQ